MAMVSEQDSGEITRTLEGDVKLTFCLTSESEDNRLIVTSQMLEFGDVGFLPIAIARIDPNDPCQFSLWALEGLSESLQFALITKGCQLVHDAFDSSALTGLKSNQYTTKAWQ